MFHKLISTGICILMAGSLFLAACSPSQPSTKEPAGDPNAVYTEAARTVEAQMQTDEARRPTSTATEQPTNTSEPSATPEPSVTPTLGTPEVTGTPVVAPTATVKAAGATGDKCAWVDQAPKDGTKITANASWDMKIVVQNSGTTTWDKTYALKFWGGDKMGSPNDFNIVGEVKPGATYTFAFRMTAPGETGKKQSNWVVQSGEGVNFCFLFLQVEIE